jgi:hypothetical protein
MKIYIRTSKGDTDLLPDTVDCAHRISGIDSSIHTPFKLTAKGVTATKDGLSYTPWEASDELYPSDLVFDLVKGADNGDTGNLALFLQKFDTGNPARFSLVIDGGYYQNLGCDRCLDESSFPVRFSYLTVDPKPVVPPFGKWTIDGPCGYMFSTPDTMFGDSKVPVYQITRIA